MLIMLAGQSLVVAIIVVRLVSLQVVQEQEIRKEHAGRLQDKGFELKPGQAAGTKKEIGIDDQFQSDPKSRGEFDVIDVKK